MSTSYERPTTNELITFPGDDTVQVNGTLDVKTGDVSVLRTTPSGLTTRLVVCDNVETSTSNMNAIATSVGNLTTATTNMETEYNTLQGVQQGHTQRIRNLQSATDANAEGEGASTSFTGSINCANVVTPTSDVNTMKTDLTSVQNKVRNQNAIPFLYTSFTGDVYASRFIKTGGQATQYLMADGSVIETSGTNDRVTALEQKTRNQSAVPLLSTSFTGEVSASKFIKTDGQPSQYLMADGSVLDTSGTNDRVTALEQKTFAISKTNASDSDETSINSALNMQDHRITQVSNPEAGQDVVTKSYMEDQDYATKDSIVKKFTDFISDTTTEADLGGAISAASALLEEGGVAAIVALIALKLDTLIAYQQFFLRDGTNPMTGNANMGGFSINNTTSMSASGDVTAARFIKVGGGLPTEFLKSNGTYDSSSYITQTSSVFTDLQARTQNMTCTGNNTTVSGTVTVAGVDVDWKSSGTYTNNNTFGGDTTVGAMFTVNSDVFVTIVYIPAVLYTDIGPRKFSFWNATGSLVASYDIPKTSLVDGNYILRLSVPLFLVGGFYIYGVNGTSQRFSESVLTFNPLITGVRGLYSFGLDQIPSRYPGLGGSNIGIAFNGGFFFREYLASALYADRFIKTGGGSAQEFMKSNGTYDSSAYITATSTPFVNLESSVALKLDTSLANSTFATKSETDLLATRATALENRKFNIDVVSLSIADAEVKANSYDYYIQEEMTTDIRVASIRIACAVAGSDSIRVAIYRFGAGVFVLCGQSLAVVPAAVMTIPVSTVGAANLNFTRGESFLIGIAVNGTTTQLRGVKCTANTSRFYYNTSDSIGLGFPGNPRPASGSSDVIPCVRLIAA